MFSFFSLFFFFFAEHGQDSGMVPDAGSERLNQPTNREYHDFKSMQLDHPQPPRLRDTGIQVITLQIFTERFPKLQ